MEGKRVDPDLIRHDEYEYWFAAHHWHWTPAQLDECPGVLFDYMGAIEVAHQEVTARSKSDG